MTSTDDKSQLERLFFIYQRVREVVYGCVNFWRVDAPETGKEIPLGEWEFPFTVSKQLGQHEIVYGSVLHLIREAARPISRIEALEKELHKSLPSGIRESMVESLEGDGRQRVFTLPTGEFPALFLHKHDEIMKDTVLLSGLHVRTLLEVFSGKGNLKVPTYDYEGNPAAGVSMQQLLHTLIHHRYCVVSNGFICDVFSGDDTRGLPDTFGTKVKSRELLEEVLGFLAGITVNDFVGMLRVRLQHLSMKSKTRDIIFAHQNVYALTEMVWCRREDKSFLPFLNYLFGQLTTDERREIDAAKDKSGFREVGLERRYGQPGFKIGGDLDAKVIEVSIKINDKQERYEFSQQEFFEELTATCGNEPIIPFQRLQQQIADLAESG